MIRVNLLKNRAAGTKDVGATEFADVNFEDGFENVELGSGSDIDSKETTMKIVVILLWPVLLYAYEWYNISDLTERDRALKAQLNQVTNEVTQKKPEIEKAKALEKENVELEKKIVLIKELGQLRLREIRAIDHLQNIIPERVWFSKIKFEGDQFELEGISSSDAELDKLLDGIRSYDSFSDVLLARAVEEKTKRGTLKKFLITSRLAEEGT